MKQKKEGILILATMILSIGLMAGVQVVKATDGDLNVTGGILLKDTNANGKIDKVQITVDYVVATASAIEHATDEETTIGKFTVTDSGTSNLVTVSSVAFESGDGTIAIFNLVLDETDADLSINTSGTALDIVYDATVSDLKITDGSVPVPVAAITTETEEKDGAQPIILTAVDQNGASLDGGTDIPVDANIIITFSEPMDITTLDANDEWSISPDPESWLTPSWSNSDKTLTFEQTVNFIFDDVETVTLSAPLAVGGVEAEDKELQESSIDSAVDNPFTFTVVGEADDDEITPPDGADVGNPTTPNYHSGVTLYRMPGSNRVYVIKNKKKHWIKTAKEFKEEGYNWNEIEEISAKLLEEYPEAETLVSELLRAKGDHKVYKIKEGKKYWIRTAKEFEDGGYNWDEIKEVSSETLTAYQDMISSTLLRAKGDHKVYKIKEGKKYWIRTAEEFNIAGYNWEEIEEVIAETLDSYPDSDSVADLIKIVNASVLRVRSINSTIGDILGGVKNSEVYNIIEKKNGWYKIKMRSGKTGWVSGVYTEEQ